MVVYVKACNATVWINYFKDLRDAGLVDTSNKLHIECVRFAYTEMIQRDFSHTAELWNQQFIRNQRDTECASSKPDMLYFRPELYGSQDYKMPLNYSYDDLQAVKDEYCEEFPPLGCSLDFVTLLNDIVGDVNDYVMPSSKVQRKRAYKCFYL